MYYVYIYIFIYLYCIMHTYIDTYIYMYILYYIISFKKLFFRSFVTINIKSWQSPDPFVVGIGPEPVVLRVGSLNTPISRRIRNYMGQTEIPCAIYLPCLAKHQGLATPPHILTFAMVLILDGYSEHVAQA